MKRILSLCILTCLIFLSFTSCFWQGGKSTRELEISKIVGNIYDDMNKQLKNPQNIDAINNYLISWAADNHIPVSYDMHKNIIMSKRPTIGFEDAPAITLHCSIGGANKDYYEAMASILFFMKNLEEHGFIRGIFTADTDEKFEGSSNISNQYLDTDILISFIKDGKTSFIRQSPYLQTYSFEKDLTRVTPTGNAAFEISLGPFNLESSGKVNSVPPNPIKQLGDLFAYMKSKGIPIELSSIEGGPSIYGFPTYAKAVFIINENDVNKFQKYFSKDKEKFLDKYKKLHEKQKFSYNYSAVSVPEQVVSKEDTARIISLLYTMVNGPFLKNENDTVTANTTLSSIFTDESSLELKVCSRALSHEVLNEIKQTMEIIANLNEAVFRKLSSFPAWHIDEKSSVYNDYVDFFETEMDKKIDTKSTLQASPIALFKEKNNSMDAIAITINMQNDLMELEALEKLFSTK